MLPEILYITKMLKLATFLLLVIEVSSSNKTNQRWLKRNNLVFDQMFYNTDEIMNLKDHQRDFTTATISSMKIFWTKQSKAPSCSRNWKWWFDRPRIKRAECSSCCSTDFKAIAPLSIDYNGQKYDVYHPADGYQILFIGECSLTASCSFGTCQPEDDYHTWILIHDPALNYTPEMRFVPVSYSKYCKCVNHTL